MTNGQVDCFFAAMPRLINLERELIDKPVVDIIATLLLKGESKSKVKKLIQGNAVHINGNKFQDERGFLKDVKSLKGSYFVVRIAGKDFYTLKTSALIENE